MIGTLTDKQINDFLESQLWARLGCHHEGRTYVVPFSYVLDGDGLLGQTTPGLKVDMMRANPAVCVEVDEIKDLTDWKSVILRGQYEELEHAPAIRAMGLMIDKYGPVFRDMESATRVGRQVKPPRLDGEVAPVVLYRIHITEKSGRFEVPD